MIFSQLPATPNVRDQWTITDSLTAILGAVELGGGAYTCPVFWNGTNWIDNPSGPPSIAAGVPPMTSQQTVAQLPCYQQVILADNPVGYWRLGEASGNFADSSGNSNTATVTGSFTYSVMGAITDDINKGVTQATTALGTVAASGSMPSGNTFSLECWFKRSATQGTAQYFMMQKINGLQFFINAANQLVAGINGGALFFNSGVVITDTTTWHHFVVTKSGSTRAGYVDGVQTPNSILVNQTVAPADSTMYLMNNSAGTAPLNQSCDEIAVYNYALSAAQVANHYNEGRSLKNGRLAYATNGTPASVPLTSGGSGVSAVYSGGRWCAVL